MLELPQGPIAPGQDLREMLRRHVIGRSLECMAHAKARRQPPCRPLDIPPGTSQADKLPPAASGT